MKDHVDTVHLKKFDAFRMRQRPPIHVNCKIFYDFLDILHGKKGGVYLLENARWIYAKRGVCVHLLVFTNRRKGFGFF